MTFPAFVKAVLRKAAALAGKAHAGLAAVWCLPVRLYRKFLSPLKPAGSCRFTPTCSRYFLDAVREWGILIGTLMGIWRVLRCNPFSKGGHDPVPERSAVLAGLKARFRERRKEEPAKAGNPESRRVRTPKDGGSPRTRDSQTEN